MIMQSTIICCSVRKVNINVIRLSTALKYVKLQLHEHISYFKSDKVTHESNHHRLKKRIMFYFSHYAQI